MNKPNKPYSILKLDKKPGRDWARAEVTKIIAWLMDREQERVVWYAAARYLGGGGSVEDVEEAWVAFYAEIVEAARLSYRPGGPDFFTYALHVCFKRECVRRGEKIRNTRMPVVSLHVAAVEEETADDELVDSSADPCKLVERKRLVEEISLFLTYSKMPVNHKRAFELKYLSEMSNEEAAWELEAEVGTVKVWAHRAAAKIKEHLAEKGWVCL